MMMNSVTSWTPEKTPATFRLAGLTVSFVMACTFLTMPEADAELLAYDGFAVGGDGYIAGNNLVGQGEGSGWAGAWTGTTPNNDSLFYASEGSLAADGYESEAGYLVFGGGSQSMVVGREYATTFGSAAYGGEVWASSLLQFNSSREFKLNFFATSDAGAGQYFGLHSLNGTNDVYASIRWGTASQLEFSSTAFTMTQGVDYVVVAQALMNASGVQDTLNVWIQEVGTYDGSLNGGPTLTVSYDMTVDSFDSVAIFNQNPLTADPSVIVDEFRVGTGFSDVAAVVPEPSHTALIGGLFSLVLLGVRRRV